MRLALDMVISLSSKTISKELRELSLSENDYKDKLEWIEIEEKGVKYIIRVEDRIQKEEQ